MHDSGLPTRLATQRGALAASLVVSCAAALGCHRADPGPDLQILGESTRRRADDPVPLASPWFDGSRVDLVAARGETLGLQILHRGGGAVTLTIAAPGVGVHGYDVASLVVTRPSTAMYGGSHGAGAYPDALTPSAAPTTDPAYFDVAIAADATPGTVTGQLEVAGRRFPVRLVISAVTLPPLAARVWAYEDPRELTWAGAAAEPAGAPSAAERSCVAVFREHGVLLSPDLHLDWYAARRDLLAGVTDLPVVISDDPVAAAADVRGWIAATAGTDQLPFAIPIDEPRTAEQRRKVRVLADAVRAAGGGPRTFRFAVTDEPRPEYGDAIDLYISPLAAHLTGDRVARWTYNGFPPRAGAMVLDAETPGARTWGWIGWRWQIPTWYVWDALYWHDRHNRHGAALPGRPLDAGHDAVSFDDGDDHGDLDGVLALPLPDGCQPTLRLASVRRGLQDRALLELAMRCDPGATVALGAAMVPAALGDAPASGPPSWPTDDAAWEHARRQLLDLAACAGAP